MVREAAKSSTPVGKGSIMPVFNSEATSEFLGVFNHSIDEKGRISFPVEFRTALSGQSLVLTNYISDGARCLEGFSADSWQKFISGLRAQSRFEPRIRQLENFYLARAHQCTLDTSGRIIIPQHLRTYAGLEREVVFSSSLHGFRLWDQRVWELVFREAEAALLEDPSLFVGLDTLEAPTKSSRKNQEKESER